MAEPTSQGDTGLAAALLLFGCSANNPSIIGLADDNDQPILVVDTAQDANQVADLTAALKEIDGGIQINASRADGTTVVLHAGVPLTDEESEGPRWLARRVLAEIVEVGLKRVSMVAIDRKMGEKGMGELALVMGGLDEIRPQELPGSVFVFTFPEDQGAAEQVDLIKLLASIRIVEATEENRKDVVSAADFAKLLTEADPA